MKVLQIGSIIVTTTIAAVFPIGKNLSAKPNAAVEAEINSETPSSIALSAEPGDSSEYELTALPEEEANADTPKTQQTKSEDYFSVRDYSPDATPATSNLSYLSSHPYAELPQERKSADVVLDSLGSVPIGTPLEEIKRASDAFGLDFSFMRAVAKIESDFNPRQRTGSYIGLFQLNRHEFAKYGSGEITSPRDNAIAAAYKFVTEATFFELDTHKKPTFSDLYLIHQQGWRGAAEHVSQPDRIAWRSMCATDEGRQKGEKWCKRAIWLNTLPAIKHVWKSVDKLTSGAFVDMWRKRVDRLYAHYSEAAPRETLTLPGS
jgi:Transglycosylase SLT domain